MLPALGSTLALAAVVGGGLALHPELLDRAATASMPAASPAANTSATGSTANGSTANGAARATVTSGMDPVTGANSSPGWTVDKSLLGVPWTPGPSTSLPELTLQAPGPGVEGGVVSRTRSQQFGHTTRWTAQPQVDGPVRRIVRTVAVDGYIVVPNEAGDLHLLCGDPRRGSYYVDSHAGEWRVYRVDGGPNYDVSYRFVQYDRSPLSAHPTCQ